MIAPVFHGKPTAITRIMRRHLQSRPCFASFPPTQQQTAVRDDPFCYRPALAGPLLASAEGEGTKMDGDAQCNQRNEEAGHEK